MTDDRQTENAAPGGTCAAVGSADDFRKIRHCIGLLNSMVRGGERHSDTSARMTVEALEALERIEQPNPGLQGTPHREEYEQIANAKHRGHPHTHPGTDEAFANQCEAEGIGMG